ncbi:hypothetical protein FOMPIDRAFT_1013434 [Fomitopsis schrenkii]|uniref:G-protein coupled receptors family 1 profile domain-containing protein n=1 Tax=Fomitopsis schrenkii TaxID=2126942 RepID=S8EL41_FOMSC|nr:hypothetical protein FOMPIDRAFT_1013434 [Fomitopsis schrenkii]
MTDPSVAALQTNWTSNLFDMAEADALQGDFVATVFNGGHIGAAFLGVHVATFAAAVFALRQDMRTSTRVGLRVLVSLLCCLAFVNEACNVAINALAQDYDDGTPDSTFHYFMLNQPSRVNGAAITSALLTTLLADVFLLVRCYQWWKNPWAIIPLVMLFIASFVWNIVAGAYSVGRATELYSILVMPIYLGWPVTAGLFGAMHVIYTILIAARTIVLARASGRPRPTLGSIIVESALPYGIVSLVFMILYCAGVMAANCLIPLLVQLQGIAVDLIVIRIARQPEAPLTAVMPLPLVVAQGSAGTAVSVQLSAKHAAASIAKSEASKGTDVWGWSLDRKVTPPPEYSP